jgi:hypothetical protein
MPSVQTAEKSGPRPEPETARRSFPEALDHLSDLVRAVEAAGLMAGTLADRIEGERGARVELVTESQGSVQGALGRLESLLTQLEAEIRRLNEQHERIAVRFP